MGRGWAPSWSVIAATTSITSMTEAPPPALRSQITAPVSAFPLPQRLQVSCAHTHAVTNARAIRRRITMPEKIEVRPKRARQGSHWKSSASPAPRAQQSIPQRWSKPQNVAPLRAPHANITLRLAGFTQVTFFQQPSLHEFSTTIVRDSPTGVCPLPANVCKP